MNKQSNTYIISYSIILVVVVAVVLAFTAITLQPIQKKNVEIEKKTDILNSVGLYKPEEGVSLEKSVDTQYNKYITKSFLVNAQGEIADSKDANAALMVLNNMKSALHKPENEKVMPVFVSDNNGKINYIFPVYGTGLWGPVWGYIALNDDLSTIAGVVFDHKSETPGLGAEITTSDFEGQFIGKSIFDNDKYVGIFVLKGVGSSKGNNNAVDAISGGTITSRAVQTMIIDNLSFYQPFILKHKEISVKQSIENN